MTTTYSNPRAVRQHYRWEAIGRAAFAAAGIVAAGGMWAGQHYRPTTPPVLGPARIVLPADGYTGCPLVAGYVLVDVPALDWSPSGAGCAYDAEVRP